MSSSDRASNILCYPQMPQTLKIPVQALLKPHIQNTEKQMGSNPSIFSDGINRNDIMNIAGLQRLSKIL